MSAPCVTCESPDRFAIESAKAAGVGWKSLSSTYGIDAQALRRHFAESHQRALAPSVSDGPDTDPEPRGPEIPADATPAEKLKIVTDHLERRITGGSARSDEIREYRIALKDLHAMRREEEGPKRVTMADVEGLPELFAVLAEVLEPFPHVRRALAEALEARGLADVLG